MGASSVTGVSGIGYARNQKGSEHTSIGVNKLVGPRVMAAGSQVFDGTTTVVEVPGIGYGDVEDLVVVLTGNSSTRPYISIPLAAESGPMNFQATGANSSTLNWMIVKTGL